MKVIVSCSCSRDLYRELELDSALRLLKTHLISNEEFKPREVHVMTIRRVI